MRHAASHAMRALRNAFFSSGRRLFGLSFSLDYLRFAWRARRMDDVGPGSLTVAGMRVGYDNQSHALFLLHEIFVTPSTTSSRASLAANRRLRRQYRDG